MGRHAALLIVLLLTVAAPARAATVEYRRAAVPASGPVSVELDVIAAPGERNRIEVRRDGAALLVRDEGAPLQGPAEGCDAPDPNTIRCPVSYEEVVSVSVASGDGDDVVEGDDDVSLSISGGPGADRLHGFYLDGGSGDDILSGGPYLTGGGGDDQLRGGRREDTLDGGAGDDLMDGGRGQDIAFYGQRRAPVKVDLADPAPDGAAGEADVIRGIESVTGGAGPDTLAGDDRSNILRACDKVCGRRAGETIAGRGGPDRITGGSGADRLDGGESNDVLSGGAGDDVVRGRAGDDFLDGDHGDDRVDAGPGDDDVTDSDGADDHRLGPGDDRLSSDPDDDPAPDRIDCDRGGDRVSTPRANDRVRTNCETLALLGARIRLAATAKGLRLRLAARTGCRVAAAVSGGGRRRLRRSAAVFRAPGRLAGVTLRLTGCISRAIVRFEVARD